MFLAFALAVASLAGDDLATSLNRSLSVRDGFVGCDAVWASGDGAAVRDALIAATRETLPPSVPMRAAECLLGKAGEDPVALDLARAWMKDPAVSGFALLVVQHLDGLPEPTAVELAQLAVDRAATDARFARYAPRSLEASQHEGVRAMAPKVRAASDLHQ
jgi:hypothetical protein